MNHFPVHGELVQLCKSTINFFKKRKKDSVQAAYTGLIETITNINVWPRLTCFFFFKIYFMLICLAVLDLSCSTWDFSLWPMGARFLTRD